MKNKKNILTFFLSIILSIYLINSYFFVMRINGKGVNITKFNFYQQLKKTNNNITLSLYGLSHYFDNGNFFSLSDQSYKKTIHCNENGYFSIFNTDRYGFNNPDKVWENKEIKFMLVGDSFTHGACVNEEDTISGNLKKILFSDEVLNLGYTANGPLKELATLKEYLTIKKVERVLWIYTERNDLYDLANELNNKILKNYLTSEDFIQDLKNKQNFIDKNLHNGFKIYLKDEKNRKHNKRFISFLRLYDLRNFINSRTLKFKTTPQESKSRNSKETFNKFSEIMNLVSKMLNKNGTKLYFIYLPDFSRYNIKKNQNASFHDYEKVINIINKINIPIIDLNNELFAKHPEPLSLFPAKIFGHYRPDHYNELGYKLVTKTIYERIKEYENK